MARWLKSLFWITGIMLLVAIAGVGLYVYYVPLPTQDLPRPTRFLDREGEEIPTTFSQNRIIISQEDMPAYLRDAFVAIEDYRFYKHFGLDPVGIARAFWKNLRARRIVEGGSTITQQLAKNLFLTPERTLARKIPEVLLTLQLEVRFTKEEILTMYMNQIYFGHGAYGVETASRTFFGESARDLTLAESALLAGVPRAPGRYSPLLDLEAAVARQHLILDRMAELGYITEEQAAAAKAEEITLVEHNQPVSRSQYFIDYLVKELEKSHPRIATALAAGGLTVHTTMDRHLQQTAEQVLVAGLPAGEPDERGVPQPQGALVAMDPATGHILAMVGGSNYQETQFNRATALRQPGSAFKPFVYLAALERGYTLAHRIMCQEVEFTVPGTGEVYKPTDSGSEPYHNRPLTLREALVISDNVVSSILNYELGPEAGIECAQRLGIESTLKPYLSSALGTSEVTLLELVRAFCPLANGGRKVEPIGITKITDAQGRILLENKPQLRQVADSGAVYIITDVLQDVLEPGGTAANIGWKVNRPAAGKTGTSQDYGNAWFAGYTPNLVAAVWVGMDRAAKSAGGSGAKLAAPIWADFIQQGLAGTPRDDFPRPENVSAVEICAESGLRDGWWCPREDITTELFLRGTEPWRYCDVHSPLDWNWFDRFLPPQWDRPRMIPEGHFEGQEGNNPRGIPAPEISPSSPVPPPSRPQAVPRVEQERELPTGEQRPESEEPSEPEVMPPAGGKPAVPEVMPPAAGQPARPEVIPPVAEGEAGPGEGTSPVVPPPAPPGEEKGNEGETAKTAGTGGAEEREPEGTGVMDGPGAGTKDPPPQMPDHKNPLPPAKGNGKGHTLEPQEDDKNGGDKGPSPPGATEEGTSEAREGDSSVQEAAIPFAAVAAVIPLLLAGR